MIYLLSFIATQIIVFLEILLNPKYEYSFKFAFWTSTLLYAILFTTAKILTL